MTETPTSPSVDGETMTHTRSCGYFDPEIGCTCCLEERKALATEQAMHRAWRKRAEEAEAALTRPAPSSPALDPVERNRENLAAACKLMAGELAAECTYNTLRKTWVEVMECIRALIGQPAPSSTVGELDQGNASVASPSNGHPGVEAPVAWRYKDKDDENWLLAYDEPKAAWDCIEPLYTAGSRT